MEGWFHEYRYTKGFSACFHKRTFLTTTFHRAKSTHGVAWYNIERALLKTEFRDIESGLYPTLSPDKKTS